MLNWNKQTGVSLIEILVTTLILGIGLLGVASLQISGISSNLEGFYTSQATAIAEELATRIRSSKVVTMIPTSSGREQVIYSDYLLNYWNNGDEIDCPQVDEPAPELCRSNGSVPDECGMQALANFDLQEACWIAKNTLPDSSVRVAMQGNRLTIVVDWASTAARNDFGEIGNVNAECIDFTQSAQRNCVLMELVP